MWHINLFHWQGYNGKKNHSLVTKITILIIYAHTIIKKNVCIACFKRSVNAYHWIDGRNRVTEYVRESLYTRKWLFKNKNYHTGKRQNFFVGKHSKLWSLQTAKEWNQIGTRYINSANLWPYSLLLDKKLNWLSNKCNGHENVWKRKQRDHFIQSM